MKKEDKIRNRKSYKRFAAILEVLESDEIIEKKNANCFCSYE